jgi:hypothetical protein
MAMKTTIEQARSAAMVGTQIGNELLQWGGRQAFEAFMLGANQSWAMTERGIRVAKLSAKIMTRTAEQALPDSTELIKQQAHDTWAKHTAEAQGIIDTSIVPETITAARTEQLKAGLDYIVTSIEHGLTVELPDVVVLAGQMNDGGIPTVATKSLLRKLSFTMPVGQMVESAPGLDRYIGSIDPSVQYDVVEVGASLGSGLEH